MSILKNRQPSNQISISSDVVPSAKVLHHPSGMKGNLKTISFIKEIAHQAKSSPLVRSTAEQIFNLYRTKSHNHADEAMAIGDFVKRKVGYAFDPIGVEMLIHPDTLISRLSKGLAFGDCDDMTLMCCSLLLSIGIQPYLCCVKRKKDDASFTHIYVCVYTNNYKKKQRRIVLDAILKDKKIGYEVKAPFKQEFKV